MRKSVEEVAREIRGLASGSGMKTREVFDALIDGLFHANRLLAGQYSGDESVVALSDCGVRAATDRLVAAGCKRKSITKTMASIVRAVEQRRGDVLGDLAAMLETLSKSNGQFFTPYELSDLTAQLTIDQQSIEAAMEKKGYIELQEPTAGAGSMILAAADRLEELGYCRRIHMSVAAMDIEYRAFQMCYIQLSLRDIPAAVYHGDVLAMTTHQVAYTPVLFSHFHLHHQQLAGFRDLMRMVQAGPLAPPLKKVA